MSVDEEPCNRVFICITVLLVEALNVIPNSHISEFLLDPEFFFKWPIFIELLLGKPKQVSPRFSMFIGILNQIPNS